MANSELSGSRELNVVVAASYTSEPIKGALAFWLTELGFDARVVFAPYNQLLQQFLDPNSLVRHNRGVNLVLFRFEDFARQKAGGWDAPTVRAATRDLADALRVLAEHGEAITIVAALPPTPRIAGDPVRSEVAAEMERDLRAAVSSCETVHMLARDAIASEAVEGFYDAVGDRVGHMPHTPLFEAALATSVARLLHAIQAQPHKVVALDCDNTLWRGVLGEDGPDGITLDTGAKCLQEFIVAQQAAGMLVCLVSKNSECEVLNTLDYRKDFPLRREHLVAWRIGWGRKSDSLAELARELNLGLDSFIFLDDDPVECALVRADLPQVLTLRVPPDRGVCEFLRHAWAFDRLKVTQEDRARTRMYRENVERSRLERQAPDIETFLASLELVIDIGAPSEEEWARVAQLTQRTNQFNLSTVRRTEAEVRRLAADGLECLRVEVADRYGDYGVVGVMVTKAEQGSLVIDTMLLSCRVLGRGVEHAMLAHLGRLALKGGLADVEARYLPTPKNEPARRFLESLCEATASPAGDGSGTRYRIPAAAAAAVTYRPGKGARDQLEFVGSGGKTHSAGGWPGGRDKSAFHERIISELCRPAAVLAAVDAASATRRAVAEPLADPQTALQRELAAIWRRVLHLDRVGIRDAFADLGGDSLKAAQLFVAIEAQFGVRLPMTTILEVPTIEGLAACIAAAARGEVRHSLKLLKPGQDGGRAIFFVHDGDGETLLYLNLARRLPKEIAVYGLEPDGRGRCAMVQTRVPEMAAHYVARILEVQTEGPFFLGGLCAGGTIAFEMAMQLRASGHVVGLVALLDAADARAKIRPFLETARRWDRFRQSLRRGGRTAPGAAGGGTADSAVPRSARRRTLTRTVRTVIGKLRSFAAYEVGVRVRDVSDALKIRALRASVARGNGLHGDFDGLSVRTIYRHAERKYEPAGRLDAPILLIRAGRDGCEDPSDEPLLVRYRDPLFGWGRRAAGGPSAVTLVDVPGGHSGMLQEPHVSAVAAPIRAAIDCAVSLEAGS